MSSRAGDQAGQHDSGGDPRDDLAQPRRSLRQVADVEVVVHLVSPAATRSIREGSNRVPGGCAHG